MSVIVTCQCGKRLRAKDGAVGKRVKCPACGKVLRVPDENARSATTEASGPIPAISATVLLQPAESPEGDALQDAVSGSGPSDRRGQPSLPWQGVTARLAQLEQQRSRTPWLVAGTVLTVLLLSGLAFLMGRRNREPDSARPVEPGLATAEEPKARDIARAEPKVEATKPAPRFTHPSPSKLSERDFWEVARSICDPSAPKNSVGMRATFEAVFITEGYLVLADQRVTDEEFVALASYYLHIHFGPRGRVSGVDPLLPMTAETFQRDIASMLESYSFVISLTADQRSDALAKFNDPESHKKGDSTVPSVLPDELLAELARYRISGPTASNQPYRPPSVTARSEPRSSTGPSSSDSSRAASSGAAAQYRVGDYVRNPGFLQNWGGRIVEIKDGVYRVRITYVRDAHKSKYKQGEAMEFLPDEIAPATSTSIDALLKGTK